MNSQLKILITWLIIIISSSTYATGLVDENKRKDIANKIVNECVSILQKQMNKNSDSKTEVYSIGFTILSDYVILNKVILIFDAMDKVVSIKDMEGICRYNPDSKMIVWQPVIVRL